MIKLVHDVCCIGRLVSIITYRFAKTLKSSALLHSAQLSSSVNMLIV